MKRYVVMFIVIFVIFFFWKNKPVDLSKYTSQVKQVEIKGEIKKPGVYEVKRDATIKDIIEEAGGLLQTSDVSHLNLSYDIENNGVIVVRKVEEIKKISINSATIEELDSLSGIGPAIAKRIVEYRAEKPFATLEEIMNVKGIGLKMFERIKDSICVK